MNNNQSEEYKAIIDSWKELTGKNISIEDAREMMRNLSGFFRVISEWDA